MSSHLTIENKRALTVIREQLAEATAARKCHTCGCLHATVEALATTSIAPQVAEEIEGARRVFAPKKYDCLGCAICFPAVAANAFAEEYASEAADLDLCPTEAPEVREGWPPLPGDYRVLRYQAPVAVCTLNSAALVDTLAEAAPEGLSIVGTMHTENLGIERVIRNVLGNPYIRFLVVCGEDTRQRVGHLPGQSLVSLAEHGVDDAGRIDGARGRRPILKNVTAQQIEIFRARVTVIDLVGISEHERIASAIAEAAMRNPGPANDVPESAPVEQVEAPPATRLVRDPAGFFVLYPDAQRNRIVVEHYTNAGVLDVVLSGQGPADLYVEIVARGLVTRLDHAAYLGRELARAERALGTGEGYVQDRAAGEEEPVSAGVSGCGTKCGESA